VDDTETWVKANRLAGDDRLCPSCEPPQSSHNVGKPRCHVLRRPGEAIELAGEALNPMVIHLRKPTPIKWRARYSITKAITSLPTNRTIVGSTAAYTPLEGERAQRR
jgi:hypothetical protein